MFAMQPKEKLACLTSCDVQKMTPIHCAAMFDHPDIVNYLIAEGSDVNPLDKERRSPLLLAASRAGWRTVHILVRLNFEYNIPFKKILLIRQAATDNACLLKSISFHECGIFCK